MKENVLGRLEGVTVYATIHEALGNQVELLKDPKDGYLYSGRIIGKVLFSNGDEEIHHLVQLSRPIRLHEKDEDIYRILVTPRYEGEEMIDILDDRMLTANFCYLGSSTLVEKHIALETRLKKHEFKTKQFVWIGVGEISTSHPKGKYFDAPWEMIRGGDV